MPARFQTTIHTRATLARAIDYYLHPENLVKVHPEFIKKVRIVAREKDSVVLEQHAEMMGQRIVSLNRLHLDRPTSRFVIDTIDGDGKGSRIIMLLRKIPSGTEVRYRAFMELGPLGFFVKGQVELTFERTAQQDKRQLDMLV